MPVRSAHVLSARPSFSAASIQVTLTARNAPGFRCKLQTLPHILATDSPVITWSSPKSLQCNALEPAINKLGDGRSAMQ